MSRAGGARAIGHMGSRAAAVPGGGCKTCRTPEGAWRLAHELSVAGSYLGHGDDQGTTVDRRAPSHCISTLHTDAASTHMFSSTKEGGGLWP